MATLVRFREPFREMATLHNEMSRLAGGFFDANGRTNQAWAPAVDVWETEDEIVYAFDLPGIPEDKISVELDDGALTVSAEREREQKTEGRNFYRAERRFGSFSRTIGVPQGVSENDVSAQYEHGVLQVHVRKPEQPKPRKIQVGVGGSSEQKTIEGKATQK